MKKEILIIDDEEDIRKLARLRLEDSGYKIVTANSAEESLEVLKKEIPDLILLDLLLPSMQGEVLCKKLKLDKRLKKIPIILFTATARDLPKKIKEMGADDYILKPYEAGELLEKIKRFIG